MLGEYEDFTETMSITYNKEILKSKGNEYCQRNDTSIARELGFGTQGVVFKTKRNTAIKVYNLEAGYERERNVYQRLQERNIQSVRNLVIPRIMNWADDLFVFEMSIVHVPCIIDFGGAYLDKAPEHMVRDVIWLESKAEEFGINWEEAQAVIRELEFRADLWLSDVNTGNIKFSE